MTKYFTNNFAVINLYKKSSVKSEIVTQMIYGDTFSISRRSKKWFKIKIKEDGYNGFIKNRKYWNIAYLRYCCFCFFLLLRGSCLKKN